MYMYYSMEEYLYLMIMIPFCYAPVSYKDNNNNNSLFTSVMGLFSDNTLGS